MNISSAVRYGVRFAKQRNRDRPDVVRQERSTARERVAARRRQRRPPAQHASVLQNVLDESSPCLPSTTMLTRPALWRSRLSAPSCPACTAAHRAPPAQAARAPASLMSGATVNRPRSLPLTCTGITISSALRRLRIVDRARLRPPACRRGRTAPTALPPCAAQTAPASRSAIRWLPWPPRRPAPSGSRLLPLGEGIELVDQLHHRGDGRVELLPHVHVERHPPDRVVRLPPHRAFVGSQRARRRSARRRPAAAAATAGRSATRGTSQR